MKYLAYPLMCIIGTSISISFGALLCFITGSILIIMLCIQFLWGFKINVNDETKITNNLSVKSIKEAFIEFYKIFFKSIKKEIWMDLKDFMFSTNK